MLGVFIGTGLSCVCSDVGAQPRATIFAQQLAQPDPAAPPHPADQLPPPDAESFEHQRADDCAFAPITSLTADVSLPGDRFPEDRAAKCFLDAGRETHATGFSRPWQSSDYWWIASQLANRPLYFEDPNLERYGYHWGVLQPAVSAAHFFGRIPAIPYMRGAANPRQPVYSLGYYRSGSPAPYYLSRPPASAKGALYEATTVVGGVFVVP